MYKNHNENCIVSLESQGVQPDNFEMHKRHSERGIAGLEAQGVQVWYFLGIVAAGLLLAILFSGGKLSEIQQSVASIRMSTQQMYTSSLDYTGLNNDLVIKAGLAPQKLIKGGTLVNGWGGPVTVATGDDTGTFTITVAQVPQDACTKLATFQLESWLMVEVNNTSINKDIAVAEAADNCQASNTIVYTSR